jgi:hypothetical protein
MSNPVVNAPPADSAYNSPTTTRTFDQGKRSACAHLITSSIHSSSFVYISVTILNEKQLRYQRRLFSPLSKSVVNFALQKHNV